jgi:integrase
VVWLATGFVFPSPRGKLWAIRNFYRNVWTPAQQKAGVAFTLYDLRHTFASRLLAAGIPLIEVSAWMGHGLRAGGHEITNTTTRVYAHATGESRQAALDELATLIADTDPGHRQRGT